MESTQCIDLVEENYLMISELEEQLKCFTRIILQLNNSLNNEDAAS